MNRRGCTVLAILVLLGLCLIVSVPAFAYQRISPPVKQEPAWDSPQTRALAQRACFDCHSNQTRWPWFAQVPPGSWLATFDTIRGRRALNFSEWSTGQGRRAREAGEQIQRGEMPPSTYLLLHPEANLSAAEKQQLIQGLQASLR